ncbi:putative pectinesterase/pectinesterase inhibitor 28 [Malus domestica]|uniref:putative pectinesterase/pectinesterase inhibitor 28 n=1 Tax=Malus domestica TaxID=3750 RepID=UPI0010A9CBE1|nr:putative pectinesterase/pectinesterase inhibitor 28 [Malus domestica]
MANREDVDRRSKKRIVIISLSAFLLMAMVMAVAAGFIMEKGFYNSPVSGSKGSSHDKSASMKAIKTICQPTDYKQECLDSLSYASGNTTTDPIELIEYGFKVAMKYVTDAAKKSDFLRKLEKDPRTSNALDACEELMDLALSELRQSLVRLGYIDDFTKFNEMLVDLKVWLSATITYQESCLDAFENTTSSTDAAEEMKSVLNTSMHLSSNALAMVSQVFSAFTDLNNPDSSHRRLLQFDAFPVIGHSEFEDPKWYEGGVRKLSSAPKINKPDIIVAKDGSGSYKTITEALDHVPKYGNETFIIYIKEGVYNEHILVTRSMTSVMMIGDGANKTRITGNKNFADGTPTYHTATVAIQGDHFMARDIGFDNSAGPEKHQAVALRVSADEAIFYRCSMDGYQDTLYTHAQRQFYCDCTISGTIDFVFGDATAVFQNCTFLIRKPLPNQSCIVTAQGRKERRQPSAIIIQNSTITAEPDYFPVKDENKAYLGRPWKEYSRTIIMDSYIDDVIQPEGWLPWEGEWGLKTCFYAESGNTGPAANKARRVTWRGIKQITENHTADFTPGRFFRGDKWIRLSGVPYIPGLTTSNKSKTATTRTPSFSKGT